MSLFPITGHVHHIAVTNPSKAYAYMDYLVQEGVYNTPNNSQTCPLEIQRLQVLQFLFNKNEKCMQPG